MTASELYELLRQADDAAARAANSIKALLTKDCRSPDRFRLAAAHRHWVRQLPSFGHIEFRDMEITETELHVSECRAGVASFDPVAWRPGGGEPAIAVGVMSLTATRDRINLNVQIERLFSLEAIAAWLAAHSDLRDPDCGGSRVKAWPNHPCIEALAEDDGWIGQDVEGVWLVHEWTGHPI